jgi:hypothetical protein
MELVKFTVRFTERDVENYFCELLNDADNTEENLS